MEKKLKGLKPQALWNYFEDFCGIPHPSKHEEAIVAYVKEFGEKHGLETRVDHVGNVLIRKPATPGHENLKTIILQCHVDMVPQKNNDTQHNFTTDPIDVYIEGDWVKARGTTLGADNGIGAASAMAVLAADDLEHGPIECLFTIDEETGMTGVFELKKDWLRGEILLNLDSEDEGELYIGCAGGIDTSAIFNCPLVTTPAGMAAYQLNVKGLKGGHSGLDINLGRGNANKILNRILWKTNREYGLQISTIDGGSLRNAIPREASAVVVVPSDRSTEFEKSVRELSSQIAAELKNTEPNLQIEISTAPNPVNIFAPHAIVPVLNAIYACPNGVIRTTDDMPGVVETSTNLAIVKTKPGTIEIHSLQRSAVDSAKDDLCNMIRSVFELAGATVAHNGSYPGWKPNINSPILNTMKKVYSEKFGKVPEVKVIHAGLECGIIGGTYPNIDMISFGPTIRHPHSPDEKVNIPSVELYWQFLIETLKKAPVKN